MPVSYADGIKTLRAANPEFQGSDEQLYQQWLATTTNRDAIEVPGKDYSVGGFAKNVAGNVGPAVINTLAGMAGIVGKLNPVALPGTVREAAPHVPGVIRGLWSAAKGAAADPVGTLKDVARGAADYAYERPVEAAAMLSPLGRAAGMPRLASAMDVPSMAIRGAGKVLQGAGKGWMGGVAKIPSTLKEENPFDIREVLVQEGIRPTARGADKASRLIKAEQAQVNDIRNRSTTLIERKGPAGRLETPPPSPYESQPLTQTGTGSQSVLSSSAGTPQVRDVPPDIAPPPLGIERTGTGWLAPQAIPVSPGPLTQVTGTSASLSPSVRGAVGQAMEGGTPPLARPARTLEGPITQGTEELRAAIRRIDPVADTDNAMRNAFQKELGWVESQMPEPVPASRVGSIKSQLQDQVSYGVRQKELSNETLAKKKLAVGMRRVESENIPGVAPHNQRIGRLVAAEEAASEAAKRYENYNRLPARALWGLGTGAGIGSVTGNPALAAAGVLPFFVDHPFFGGAGAIGTYRAGTALGKVGQIPSAVGLTSNAMRDALLSSLAPGSTERP